MGWALDAFDAMLYSLVLAMLMRDLGMSKTTAGSLGTLTLLASGIGGVFFGFLADRIGRKHALMASILTYSVCSFASGLATSIAMLAVARFVLGLGMGGEWNTGATLVAETWPTDLRAKAISIVQSSWALGFAAAALVAGPVSRYYGWRAVFFVGILPALIRSGFKGACLSRRCGRIGKSLVPEARKNPHFSQQQGEMGHPAASSRSSDHRT